MVRFRDEWGPLGGALGILFLVLGCQSLPEPVKAPENFSQLVDQVLQLPKAQRQGYWDRESKILLDQGKTWPEVTYDTALFLFDRPRVQRVTLWGDLCIWNSPGLDLTPIPGTSVFYLRQDLDPRTRLRYRFWPEAREALGIPDPRNPHTETSGRRVDSILMMPGYEYPETQAQPGVPQGTLEKLQGPEAWYLGKNKRPRDVWFYLSAQGPKKASGPRPLLIFGDGRETLEVSRVTTVIDNMVAQGELEPVGALFIAPLDRDGEFLSPAREAHFNFIAENLVPGLEGRYPVGGRPENRVLIGASNGGEFVTFAGARYPDFSLRIFNQSGVPDNKSLGIWKTLRAPSRVYTLVGFYERPYNKNGARDFHRALEKNPSVFQAAQALPQGHSWRLWGDGFRRGILWLLYGTLEDKSFPADSGAR